MNKHSDAKFAHRAKFWQGVPLTPMVLPRRGQGALDLDLADIPHGRGYKLAVSSHGPVCSYLGYRCT